jgi:hypothetical protein
MSLYDYDPEPFESELPEGLINVEDAFEHVVESQWDDLLEFVAQAKNEEWLKSSKPFLDLLSLVSRHDKDQIRDLIRAGISPDRATEPDGLSEPRLFSVATEVCTFLENLANVSPRGNFSSNFVSGTHWLARPPDSVSYILSCRESCSLGDDLGWARDLISLTRTCRNVLFALSEASDPVVRSKKLGTLLTSLNEILQHDAQYRLAYWYDTDKDIHFRRLPNANPDSLVSCLAHWFANYLEDFSPSISLATCVECGTVFSRQRKDNVFCSKTCQNRVAYKRKKILETDALREIHVDSGTTHEIAAGLLFHHARLGLGLVQDVKYELGLVGDSIAASADEGFKARFRASRAKSIRMRVLFLHGVRTLSYTEIFDVQKDDTLHHFYSVVDREVVAALF